MSNNLVSAKQNGEVLVEAMQMLNNISEITKFLNNPNTEILKTKLSYNNIEITTVIVSCYNSKIPLRYKDYVVKYTEGRAKKISYVVMSEEQYHQRYKPSSDIQKDGSHIWMKPVW